MGKGFLWFASTLVLALSAACGGAQAPGLAKPEGKLGVADAALPFKVLRGDGGREISKEQFFAEVGNSRAVCLGEAHTNPHHHWFQLEVVRTLSQRDKSAAFGLGMEMFQRPFQGVLDDFVSGKIEESEMLSRSGWQGRWGYDWSLYRPVVLEAVKVGARLLALNVSKELKEKVSKRGLEKLSASDREKIPEMNLQNAEHRQWWDDIMASMGGSHGHGHSHGDAHGAASEEDNQKAAERAERMYTVQVLWDETMADTASRWLTQDSANRVVILAGNGHCHDSGIVARLKRRGFSTAVSVRPLIDDGQGNVAAALAAPENDFLFVMSTGH